MRASLIVGRHEYSAEAVLDFIRKHGLLQPILKEMILEQEITGIEVTDSEASRAIQRFMGGGIDSVLRLHISLKPYWVRVLSIEFNYFLLHK